MGLVAFQSITCSVLRLMEFCSRHVAVGINESLSRHCYTNTNTNNKISIAPKSGTKICNQRRRPVIRILVLVCFIIHEPWIIKLAVTIIRSTALVYC